MKSQKASYMCINRCYARGFIKWANPKYGIDPVSKLTEILDSKSNGYQRKFLPKGFLVQFNS